jgi:hypothetical protein
MPHERFYVNDNHPLHVDVFGEDGATPVLPLSATIDIVNQSSGATIISNGSATVASGLATYYVLSGSDVAQTSGKYVGYMRVQITSTVAETQMLHFDVLSKSSNLAVERWTRKVESVAPSAAYMSDDHARDWIDQGVDFLNGLYATGYTSTLGAIVPAPDTATLDFIVRVAALMARTAWWAGKGTWRDDEMSFDATPFADEWASIRSEVVNLRDDGWFTDPDMGGTVYNRDNVFYDGVKYDSPDYWYRTSTQIDPDTEIPI